MSSFPNLGEKVGCVKFLISILSVYSVIGCAYEAFCFPRVDLMKGIQMYKEIQANMVMKLKVFKTTFNYTNSYIMKMDKITDLLVYH